MRFKKHWLAIVGFVGNLPNIVHGFVWLFDWFGRVDLVISKLHEFGGVRAIFGDVVEFIFNPAPWFIFPAILVGAVLIWWDFHRSWQKQIEPPKMDGKLNVVASPPEAPNPINEIVRVGLKKARDDLLKIKKRELSFATLSAWQARSSAATRLAHANGINLHNPISHHLSALQSNTDVEVFDAVRVRLVQLFNEAIKK